MSIKLEEGDYKGAVRLACSDDSILDLNDKTVSALRSKHPPPHPDSSNPSPPVEGTPCVTVTEKDVAETIRSFPNGSAGGPDSLRPQHLKDLTGPSAEGARGGVRLLQSMTAFVILVLQGGVRYPFLLGIYSLEPASL